MLSQGSSISTGDDEDEDFVTVCYPAFHRDLMRSQSFDKGGEDEVFCAKTHPEGGTVDGQGQDSRCWKQTQEGACESLSSKRDEAVSKPDCDSTAAQVNTSDHSEVADNKQTGMMSDFTIASNSLGSDGSRSLSSPLARIREENLAKRRSLTKQLKMPQLSESTTESEDSNKVTTDSVQDTRKLSRTGSREIPDVFPSLTDSTLGSMGLLYSKASENSGSPEHSPEQEVEEKFASLSLAFKTDQLTLERRMELHQRARDITEQNIEREVEGVHEALKVLGQLCTDAEKKEIYNKLQHHVEVLEQSTSRMSSRAEVLGAVQQECRVSKAIDIMLQHMENVKRTMDREHSELEETKRMLTENRLLGPGSLDTGSQRRTLSVCAGAAAKGTRRRASLAVLQKTQVFLPPPPPQPALPLPATSATSDDVDHTGIFPSLMSGTTSTVSNVLRRASVALFNVNPVKKASEVMGLDYPATARPKPILRRTLSNLSQDQIAKSCHMVSPAELLPGTHREHSQQTDSHSKSQTRTSSSLESSAQISSQGTSDSESNPRTHSADYTDSKDRTVSIATDTEDPHPDTNVDPDACPIVPQDLERLRLLAQNSSTFEDEEDLLLKQEKQENILERLLETVPSWNKMSLHLRYSTAVLIFCVGLMTLLFTLLPRSSADCRCFHWGHIEHTLWPYLKVTPSGPPPV